MLFYFRLAYLMQSKFSFERLIIRELKRLFFMQSVAIYLFAFLILPFSVTAQLPSDQLFRKGFYYLDVDSEKAIEYLSKAIERDSSRSKYFYFRGIAKFKQGHYNESVVDFAESVKLDTSLYISYMYQGMAYKNLGNYDLAGKMIDQYIAKNGADSTGYIYVVRGKTRLESGDIKGALEDFNHLTQEYPENEQNRYYRLITLTEKGDYKSALDEVNRLLDSTPDFYGYYFYRGNLYFNLGNFPKAIQDYTTSLVFNEHNADAYFSRGIVLDTLQKHTEAIKNYTQAISINSGDGAYFSRRGNTRYTIGNHEGACLDWTIAGNLGYYEDFEKVKKLCVE